mmetsp:Transcript_79623/g.225182  ORF Transcript_79623/g.225182 Transcript_79623/m.225182 type:complete len:329 (+) Transcript_79623:249-1235(+)
MTRKLRVHSRAAWRPAHARMQRQWRLPGVPGSGRSLPPAAELRWQPVAGPQASKLRIVHTSPRCVASLACRPADLRWHAPPAPALLPPIPRAAPFCWAKWLPLPLNSGGRGMGIDGYLCCLQRLLAAAEVEHGSPGRPSPAAPSGENGPSARGPGGRRGHRRGRAAQVPYQGRARSRARGGAAAATGVRRRPRGGRRAAHRPLGVGAALRALPAGLPHSSVTVGRRAAAGGPRPAQQGARGRLAAGPLRHATPVLAPPHRRLSPAVGGRAAAAAGLPARSVQAAQLPRKQLGLRQSWDLLSGTPVQSAQAGLPAPRACVRLVGPQGLP